MKDKDVIRDATCNSSGVIYIRYWHRPTGTVVSASGDPIKCVHKTNESLLKQLKEKVEKGK